MKKIMMRTLGSSLALCLLFGCTSNLPKGHSPLSGSSQGSASQDGAPAAEGELLTGMAIQNSVASSAPATGGEPGLAQADSNVVAVLVDGDGRIVDCKIDAVQSKIEFSAQGALLTDTASPIETKTELGERYGMKKASGIGKEWDQQARALADYVIGKTADEVKGIALTEEGRPADAELAASVTISVGGWLDAVTEAVGNSKSLGAKAGDKLGLGIVTGIAKSTPAGEEDGLAQADSTYAAASFDAEGRITSCLIDGSQSAVRFDQGGQIVSDLEAPVETKNELGDRYGMKKASGIGREWNEQAAAFAAYAAGKSADELSAIALTEEGRPAGAELAASVTISVGDFNVCLQKAWKNAQ